MSFPILIALQLWLLSSTTTPNDSVKLVLPRAWEPLENSQPVFINTKKKLNFVFLMEMKVDSRRMGFVGCLVVDAHGKKGRLALLWNTGARVEVWNYSQNHILAWVTDSQLQTRWLFTGFYGELETHKRLRTQNLLIELQPNDHSPWMVMVIRHGWSWANLTKYSLHMRSQGENQGMKP